MDFESPTLRGDGDPRNWGELARTALPRNNLVGDEVRVTVPQTDTGRRAEHAQARELTPAKELGNLTP